MQCLTAFILCIFSFQHVTSQLNFVHIKVHFTGLVLANVNGTVRQIQPSSAPNQLWSFSQSSGQPTKISNRRPNDYLQVEVCKAGSTALVGQGGFNTVWLYNGTNGYILNYCNTNLAIYVNKTHNAILIDITKGLATAFEFVDPFL